MTASPTDPVTTERFMRLFLHHEREILRYVSVLVPNMHDAQDIVQETAVALLKKLDQYDPDQPFAAWACRFALQEVRQHARRRDRWPAVMDAELVDRILERRDALKDQLDERRDYLAECLDKLNGEQRTIVERYYYDRMPVERIAERLERTTDSIYKILQRVRRALSDCVHRRLRSEGASQ